MFVLLIIPKHVFLKYKCFQLYGIPEHLKLEEGGYDSDNPLILTGFFALK